MILDLCFLCMMEVMHLDSYRSTLDSLQLA